MCHSCRCILDSCSTYHMRCLFLQAFMIQIQCSDYCWSAVREMQDCHLTAARDSVHCCCHLFNVWTSDCVCVCVPGYMNHSLSWWGGGVCTGRESRCLLLLEDTQSTQKESVRWRERETNQWRCYKNSRTFLWWISVKPQVKMRKYNTDTQSLYICTDSSQPWMEEKKKETKQEGKRQT